MIKPVSEYICQWYYIIQYTLTCKPQCLITVTSWSESHCAKERRPAAGPRPRALRPGGARGAWVKFQSNLKTRTRSLSVSRGASAASQKGRGPGETAGRGDTTGPGARRQGPLGPGPCQWRIAPTIQRTRRARQAPGPAGAAAAGRRATVCRPAGPLPGGGSQFSVEEWRCRCSSSGPGETAGRGDTAGPSGARASWGALG